MEKTFENIEKFYSVDSSAPKVLGLDAGDKNYMGLAENYPTHLLVYELAENIRAIDIAGQAAYHDTSRFDAGHTLKNVASAAVKAAGGLAALSVTALTLPAIVTLPIAVQSAKAAGLALTSGLQDVANIATQNNKNSIYDRKSENNVIIDELIRRGFSEDSIVEIAKAAQDIHSAIETPSFDNVQDGLRNIMSGHPSRSLKTEYFNAIEVFDAPENLPKPEGLNNYDPFLVSILPTEAYIELIDHIKDGDCSTMDARRQTVAEGLTKLSENPDYKLSVDIAGQAINQNVDIKFDLNETLGKNPNASWGMGLKVNNEYIMRKMEEDSSKQPQRSKFQPDGPSLSQ